jgi:hypothetical protein
MPVFTLGDGAYPRPFADGDSVSDIWGHHAGLVSGGIRYEFAERFGVELWGGLMIGPRAERELEFENPERATLVTFQAGLSLSYDVLR